MDKNKEKVIVIGIDGVNWNLLDLLIQNGKLPNLKHFKKIGSTGILKSTIPPVTGPAWVTFATGRDPGSHGCYNFLIPSKTSLKHINPINSTFIKGKTFYEYLESHYKKSILINLPCSMPSRIKRGIIIPSFLNLSPQRVYPSELIKEMPILNKYRVVPDFFSLRVGDSVSLARDIRSIEKVRFSLAQELFTNKQWDFFFVLFSATDWIQHKAYRRLIQKPRSSKELVKVYEDIDHYLGWFMEHMPSYTTLFLMSDHGFKAPERFFYINQWLADEGYLAYKTIRFNSDATLPLTPRQLIGAKTYGFKGRLIKLAASTLIYIPPLYYSSGTIARLLTNKIPMTKRFIPRELLHVGLEIDTQQSSAYSIPGNVTGIYVNNSARFDDGQVTAHEYEGIRNEIITKMKMLKDPNGKQVFKMVKKKEDLYSKTHIKMAPDILYTESDHILVTTELSRPKNFERITDDVGWHHTDGIVGIYTNDPSVKLTRITKGSIADLAPSILNIFQIPQNDAMNGISLVNISRGTSDSILRKKIQYSKKVIKKAFTTYPIEHTCLAWTGGKDSTLLLWLIRAVCKKDRIKMPKILFIDEGDMFDEVREFADSLIKDWHLSVDFVSNKNVLSHVSQIGDTVTIASLDSTNKKEIKKLSYTEQTFIFEPESLIGNHLMKTVPMNQYIRKHAIQALITGIRWDEHEARSKEIYFSNRMNPRHMRIHPILHMTESDIWNITKTYDIPYNSLYEKGYRSLGVKSTTTKTSDKPAWQQNLKSTRERSGRRQDKEQIMERLRNLGYM